MKKVKAALLGLDNPHSVAHLKTLQQMPEVESILIWSEREELDASLEEASSEKVERVDTNLTSVLTDDDIHFVITCLRNDQSADVCIRALEAGKHVIAEKPIGLTAAEVQRVDQTAEALGLKLGVFYGRRYHPLVCQVREIVQRGILGTLISAELRMLTTQVRFRDPDYWLFKKQHSGGGMLSWLGCHYVDIIRYISGEEIVSVSAEVATRNGEDIDVEDVAVMSFRLASGAVGVLHVGYGHGPQRRWLSQHRGLRHLRWSKRARRPPALVLGRHSLSASGRVGPSRLERGPQASVRLYPFLVALLRRGPWRDLRPGFPPRYLGREGGSCLGQGCPSSGTCGGSSLRIQRERATRADPH